ncbi:MAG TPA: hypothetical protein VIJ94_20340 [Caulobacteraceae bacterium]
MTDPTVEPRSFQPAELVETAPDADRWAEEARSFDAVACRALIHRVRWHTGLTQVDFAAAYRIDLDHLRELERGQIQADSALIAYLTVIDRAPEVVRAALTTC